MFYCFLANGFEEIEAVTTVDMLRRADIDMKTVAVTESGLSVTGAHGIEISADMHITDAKASQLLKGVFLPGGMPGTTNLAACDKVKELINFCAENDRYIFAICAAPSVLGEMGLLLGKKATCYPGFENALSGAEYVESPAVQDGKIITGKGPGATVDFAAMIISELRDSKTACDLKSSMQCYE